MNKPEEVPTPLGLYNEAAGRDIMIVYCQFPILNGPTVPLESLAVGNTEVENKFPVLNVVGSTPLQNGAEYIPGTC